MKKTFIPVCSGIKVWLIWTFVRFPGPGRKAVLTDLGGVIGAKAPQPLATPL